MDKLRQINFYVYRRVVVTMSVGRASLRVTKTKGKLMEISAVMADGMALSVSVDPWNENSVVETFFEMGAITVSVQR